MDSLWSKSVGALKDVASIGIAKINSPMDYIDIAVIKATEHNDIPPKEEHILTALAATESINLSLGYLRDVVEKRLEGTENWMVAVKTLALIHRLMMDGRNSIFGEIEEMQPYSSLAKKMARTFNFNYRSSPLDVDCSRWVRRYSSYLSQRLYCNISFEYDILSKKNTRRTKKLKVEHIFGGLPSLQLVLCCLLDCFPRENRVGMNSLIQHTLVLLVKEAQIIYGIINYYIHRLADADILK